MSETHKYVLLFGMLGTLLAVMLVDIYLTPKIRTKTFRRRFNKIKSVSDFGEFVFYAKRRYFHSKFFLERLMAGGYYIFSASLFPVTDDGFDEILHNYDLSIPNVKMPDKKRDALAKLYWKYRDLLLLSAVVRLSHKDFETAEALFKHVKASVAGDNDSGTPQAALYVCEALLYSEKEEQARRIKDYLEQHCESESIVPLMWETMLNARLSDETSELDESERLSGAPGYREMKQKTAVRNGKKDIDRYDPKRDFYRQEKRWYNSKENFVRWRYAMAFAACFVLWLLIISIFR